MLIYQLTNCTPYQMMGYVIKTEGGKVIVVDGGGFQQSKELHRVLDVVGKEVDMWILTHAHNDHYGAIIELFRIYDDIKVKGLWSNTNLAPLVVEKMSENEKREYQKWVEYREELSFPLHTFSIGQEFDIDSVHIEVIAVDNPDIFVNNNNNQSTVLKFTDGDFSLLFLGDLGVEGGEKLIKTAGDKIKSTAVQMAHHGQGGVDRSVYELVGAKYAFWPTPDWLWKNEPYLGGMIGIGPFVTPVTIKWMEELDTINITSFESTIVFDTKTQNWKNI